MAKGSSYELQTQILLAYRLSYLDAGDAGRLEEASIEIGKMLGGLTAFLQKSTN
jgi:four helix bundle protein